MLLAELVTTSRRVGETRSRLEKIRLLAELLARLAPIEIPVGVAYLVGELRQGRIGLGWAAVRDARPGGAAAEPGLTLEAADRAFEEIGRISGAGSKAARLEALAALLARATPEEQDFLRRLVVGELRQGALEGVLVEAVARAADLPAAEVRRAAMLSGELREVATAALAVGRAALGRFRMELLRPVQPMLAGSAESPAAALGKLGRAAFEWKLDGARVQVHRRGDEVRVFTRKLNEVTASVPELVEAALALPEPELVLDGEVLALDAEGRPHPFQVTMRRFGRRLDVAALRAELPLTPFFFDVLHAGGEDWIDRPGSERWGALADLVPGDLRVPRAELEDEDAAEAFFQQALERGHEGLVAKALEAPYEAGRRGGRPRRGPRGPWRPGPRGPAPGPAGRRPRRRPRPRARRGAPAGRRGPGPRGRPSARIPAGRSSPRRRRGARRRRTGSGGARRAGQRRRGGGRSGAW